MKVSISQVKLFKACRRAYELKYVHGLVPVESADALQVGLSYHSKLESLYENGTFDYSDFSRESAMAMAYERYIYPKFEMAKVEQWFEKGLVRGNSLIGRVDGVTKDGLLVEHKTCSAEIGEDYAYGLLWDEQLLAYMLATGAREMLYTVCRKPTIRQKKDETEEQFFWRMVSWYDEDTPSKIALLYIERTDKEIREFRWELKRIISEIEHCKNYYRNCANCTRWGRRCEYSSICLHYDPAQEYIEFTRREQHDGRLEDGEQA